jgi:chemotaxis protein methyltransferase CheR
MSAALARVEAPPAPATPARDLDFTTADFAAIAKLLEARAGIHLAPHKEHLVYSRLARRLRGLGLTRFRDYRELIERDETGAETMRMVNALTTNLTRFFRESHHFDHLAEKLRGIARGGRRRLRLWSAGCSTGPEAYSMALTLAAAIPDVATWDARILASDIDTDVVATAAAGRYDASDLSDIPAAHHGRFAAIGIGEIEIAPEIRRLVAFKPLNLIGAWPMKGRFDAIFCRNVAIYFSPETQATLFDRLHGQLAPDGHLYIGHSETLSRPDRFELVGQTTYRPRAGVPTP